MGVVSHQTDESGGVPRKFLEPRPKEEMGARHGVLSCSVTLEKREPFLRKNPQHMETLNDPSNNLLRGSHQEKERRIGAAEPLRVCLQGNPRGFPGPTPKAPPASGKRLTMLNGADPEGHRSQTK